MARSTLAVDVTKDIMEFLDSEEERVTESLRKIVKATYRKLVDVSPVMTGYYASNHRVLVRNIRGQIKAGSPNPKLKPAARPEPPVFKSLTGNIPASFGEAFDRIEQIELGDSITLLTAVPYAEEVEQKNGPYTLAAAFAEASSI